MIEKTLAVLLEIDTLTGNMLPEQIAESREKEITVTLVPGTTETAGTMPPGIETAMEIEETLGTEEKGTMAKEEKETTVTEGKGTMAIGEKEKRENRHLFPKKAHGLPLSPIWSLMRELKKWQNFSKEKAVSCLEESQCV